MRVVIVEDQTLLREGLARLFLDAGHQVVALLADADCLLATVADRGLQRFGSTVGWSVEGWTTRACGFRTVIAWTRCCNRHRPIRPLGRLPVSAHCDIGRRD